MSEMSSATLLLAELEATEFLLRQMAVESLTYRGLLGVERVAHRVYRECLAPVPGASPALVEDEPAPDVSVPYQEEPTDSRLGSSREVEDLADAFEVDLGEVAASVAASLGEPGDPPAPEVDEEEVGPLLEEDSGDLVEDEDTDERTRSPEGRGSPERPLDDEATAISQPEEEASPAFFDLDEEPLSAEIPHPDPVTAPVSTDRWAEDEVEALSEEGDLLRTDLPRDRSVDLLGGEDVESDEGPTLGLGRSSSADPFANLVSFDGGGSAAEQDEEGVLADLWEEPEPADPDAPDDAVLLSDAGQDALVTLEDSSSELMSEALGGSTEEEDLLVEEEEDSVVLPDLADDGQEEIEVEDEDSPVRSSDRSGSRAPSARPAAGRGGGSVRDPDGGTSRTPSIQIQPGGSGGRILGREEEEEEPIEIGAAEDDDDGGGGFSLQVQNQGLSSEEEELEAEEEEEEEDEGSEEGASPLPPQPARPVGPSAQEIAAMFARAQAAAAAGDLQGGAELFSDLIDQAPEYLDAHVARGRLYLDLGDYSRAMSDFMHAEDLGPENPEPQVAIGDMYFARKDYRRAIDHFDTALGFAPNHAMAHCRRGISHYYRKNYAEAVTDLLRAQKLDPDIPNIQTYISMAKKKSR